ncbi:EcsC family protein [Planosporangium sp. 12N6]|uniref:EcsC family protein n=1 Tax=Planosporangium spinosum TaxID=3402278 RepID=UPI003CEC23F0
MTPVTSADATPTRKAAKAPARKAPKKATARPAPDQPSAPPAQPPVPQDRPTAPSTGTPAVPAHLPAPLGELPTPARPALWPTVKANPGYAAELLALACVEQLGPQARAQLAWLRDTYPHATAGGLARIATARAVRQARTQGALAGLLGPTAVLAATAGLLWTQARLVLDLAAVYGRDPADRDRAGELLVLLRVHPDLGAAREALDAASRAVEDATGRITEDAANGTATHGVGAGEPNQVTLPLLKVAGRALVRMATARRAARLVPGAGAVLTAILDGRGTEQLAARAAKFYRE